MTSPPGWHPDPVPPQPGQYPQLRYWDGARWTEHVAPAQAPAATQQYATPVHPGGYATPYAGAKPRPTTPDGVPLADWWPRVGATLIDTLILVPISLVLFIPFYGRIIDVYRDYFDEIEHANDTGAAQPSPFTVQTDLFWTFVIMALISLALGLVWTFFWLRWKQGTPGKLILGMRIRLRDTPGPLPWSTIGLRWLAQSAVGFLAIIPILGTVASFYPLLDGLWPLWDDKNQALHDKFAKTNVVRVR